MEKNKFAPEKIAASFRDPDGFVFRRDGILYRQVNARYKENYDALMASGLYAALTAGGLLIPHEEAELALAASEEAYKVLRPEPLPFISYPYEWGFSQLKDAALLLLQIQKKSLQFGFSLKDASAFNLQFRKGKPVLIDTLSFEKYREGEPWTAYRQFCEHFLAPLALMSLKDVRLSQLLRVYTDGVPLDLASRLLPFRTRFRFSLATHIHLHAKSQQAFGEKSLSAVPSHVSRTGLEALIDHLESAVRNLKWKPQKSAWANYNPLLRYSAAGLERKKSAVTEALEKIGPGTVWDLGANTGLFSEIPAGREIETVAFDADPAAVEKNYLEGREKRLTHLLPLWIDLTNPSSNLGWENEERSSLIDRGPADLVLALALIHHVVYAENLPFEKMASFLSKIARFLLIEYVPPTDPEAERLLANRRGASFDYTPASFEAAFGEYFSIEETIKIEASERILYLLRRK